MRNVTSDVFRTHYRRVAPFEMRRDGPSDDMGRERRALASRPTTRKSWLQDVQWVPGGGREKGKERRVPVAKGKQLASLR